MAIFQDSESFIPRTGCTNIDSSMLAFNENMHLQSSGEYPYLSGGFLCLVDLQARPGLGLGRLGSPFSSNDLELVELSSTSHLSKGLNSTFSSVARS